jgi:hypothetical protein
MTMAMKHGRGTEDWGLGERKSLPVSAHGVTGKGRK